MGIERRTQTDDITEEHDALERVEMEWVDDGEKMKQAKRRIAQEHDEKIKQRKRKKKRGPKL